MKSETRIWVILLVAGGLFLAYRVATHGAGKVYVREVRGRETIVPPRETLTVETSLSPSKTIGLWISAFFTLCILSFLYRDNPFYKFAEAVLVGMSAAYWMVVGIWTVLVPNLLSNIMPDMMARWATPGNIVNAKPLYWVPLILGVMLLCRLLPRGHWVSRWPLALIIGVTAGMRMIVYLESDFLNQIRNTVLPLIVMTSDGTFDWANSLRNVTIVTGVFTGLVYFFFSFEHTGAVGKASRIGIWFLMITFGAAFAYTVMGRITLLAQRMEFLFDDWLWLIDPSGNRLGLW